MEQERPLSEKESLDLITQMINKAKQSYYDTGISAMMWGLVIAVCSLEKLAEIQFGYTLPVDIYWLTVVAVIPQVLISINEKKNRRVKSYDEVYMDYIWLSFGICIGLMIAIINVMYNRLGPAADELKGFHFYEYTSSLFLLLYGIPTFVTGAACKFKPMLWGGILCWVSCIISLFTEIRIDLLLMAFSAIVAWLVPGVIMQKEYKKAKRELAQDNV